MTSQPHKKTRILVTGGAGFIGQHLLEELADGPYSLVIFARSQKALWARHPDLTFCYGDIADIKSLEPAFEGIDVLVHLAAEKFTEDNLEATNVAGVKNLIELAGRYGVKKIIHLSSISVFGTKHVSKPLLVTDDYHCEPASSYGITKLRSEQLFREYAAHSQAELSILRACPVFGEHQDTNYLAELLKRIKSGKPVTRHRQSTITLVYVKDIAHAIHHILRKNTAGKTFILGETLPFSDFVEFTSALMGVRCKLRYIPSFVFKVMEKTGYLGSEKLKAKFQSISGCVRYDDTYMRTVIGYRFGIKEGISRIIKGLSTEQ